MPTMPTREALRSEFDAAVQQIDQARSGSNLTSDFYARIGDSVFDAGFSALADTCDHGGHPRSPAKAKEPHRLHVVSAPVGSGKTSFAMALIASVVRLQQRCEDAPFGCLWVVDQMTKADEMYRDLNQLLPGKVAVWSTDHNPQCKHPTKVHSPTARFTKDDLQHYPVAIVNLSIVHVPAHTRKRLTPHFKVAKNRRDYVAWMITTIQEHMEPGQLGLVVCKKALFDNESVGHSAPRAHQRARYVLREALRRWGASGHSCARGEVGGQARPGAFTAATLRPPRRPCGHRSLGPSAAVLGNCPARRSGA
jgi:hypothetical protein